MAVTTPMPAVPATGDVPATTPVPLDDGGRPDALRLPEPRRRGVLVINDRAARKVVETILTRHCPEVLEATARVRFVGGTPGASGAAAPGGTAGAVEIGASLRLRYPTVALADILASVRTRLADEAGRQLGRPVRTADLTVEELVVAPAPADRRRVG